MPPIMNLSKPCCRLRPTALFPATIPPRQHRLASSLTPRNEPQAETTATREVISPPLSSGHDGRGALAPWSSIWSISDPTVPRKTASTNNADLTSRDASAMAAKLDPLPRARRVWERKKVVQLVKRRGRVTKALHLRRTERRLTHKSEFWQTSVKKLNPLARQIAGKPLEEAITQMEFSKKKYGAHIADHLRKAADAAVALRGMSLGKVEGRTGTPTEIRLKDGSRHKIDDRTSMYVDQAWVGQGPYGRNMMKRARGRRDLLRLPQTSFSVLLKEEATRVREHEERRDKERRKKPWLQLPDRPIPSHRPYYSW